MAFEAALRRIHTDLSEAHVSFALVGGLAVSARTQPRFTRDADLATVRDEPIDLPEDLRRRAASDR